MDQNEPMTLMESLKQAVRERHALMEATPFIEALTKGELPFESYVGQLRAMGVIHGTLEHEFSLVEDPQIKTLLLDRPSRLVHLRRDLTLFDQQYIPDIPAALESTRRIAEKLRLYRVEAPENLLAVLYVLQGMTLGNRVHLPDVLKAFGSLTSGTAHYYTGYGDKTLEYWKSFTNSMNAFSFDRKKVQELMQVSLGFFDQLEMLFQSLYPFKKEDMQLTAAMLNPEAGDHPVPGNTLEIKAAVTAAKKCREEFPYFDERFQERGKSFAKSDSAWLVTLADLPAVQMLSQVEWLGRVLSNRGMPRITMERQLVLLYEELSAAVPGKHQKFQGFLEAAESLKRERLRVIAEPAFTSLTRNFSSSTDSEMKGRFKRTGELIVSAVCDEVSGIEESVNSLIPWLTDRERFPEEWKKAVLNTLKRSRGEIKASGK